MDANAESDDERRLIFAPNWIINRFRIRTWALGQPLAVSCDKIRDHRRFD
jgi:hypothetical protein